MTVYYTSTEGGLIKRMGEVISRHKAVDTLNHNRIKDKKTGGYLSSLFGVEVHSVFFVKGNKVKRVWDSSLNGYRPKKFTRGLILPPTENKKVMSGL